MSELGLAGACGRGRDLHRDGVELGIVAIGVAEDECLELIAGCHNVLPLTISE